MILKANNTTCPPALCLLLALFFWVWAPVALVAQDVGQVSHLVEAKETFYSISKKYNVSIDDIKSANPGVLYPKAGEYLVIPGQKAAEPKSRSEKPGVPEDDYLSSADCRKDRKNLSRTYRVALMVPLSLEGTGTMDTMLTKSPAETMALPQFRFIQYYQGFLLAADTLADMGLNLELTVIDADQDQSKTERALNSGKLKDMDLIIGPFYKNAFSRTASYAGDNGIPIVNPLSGREDILEGNKEVFKVVPSRISQVNVLSSLVERRFAKSNLFIVRENGLQGTEIIDSLSSSLEYALGKKVPVVNYATDSLPGVRTHLRDGVHNLLIIYSESGVLPVQLLPSLNEMSKDKQITIIGLPEWEKFDQVENKYLVTLGAYLFTDSFIDYTEPDVKRFISDFRARYQAEPLEYAYAGYDAGFFFLSSMMDYGRDFAECAPSVNYPLLHTRFLFRKIPGGGYDNVYWNVYYFQDYYLVRVPYLPKAGH